MAKIQKQFEQFHETIKLGHYDENAELREKRDRILKRLKDGMAQRFAEKDEEPPKFTTFNQGSYAMGTGIKPLDSDYDIDVGVRFEIAKVDHDPVTVKEWVYEALKDHTKRVEMRRPCVTIFYQEKDEPLYHVDLAIYSDGSSNPDGKTYLAKGKSNSAPEYRSWEEADPQGLIDLIKDHFKDTEDAEQFRRAIRDLKRWRDVKFPSDGNAAPIGIGLTVAAYRWFIPVSMVTDPFSGKREYDDMEALLRFARAVLANFRLAFAEEEWAERLKVELPVVPYGDLFEKMTNKQTADFKAKLEKLLKALEEAKAEADPVETCKILRRQFGDDFPVPPKEETGRRTPPAIISSSSSA